MGVVAFAIEFDTVFDFPWLNMPSQLSPFALASGIRATAKNEKAIVSAKAKGFIVRKLQSKGRQKPESRQKVDGKESLLRMSWFLLGRSFPFVLRTNFG